MVWLLSANAGLQFQFDRRLSDVQSSGQSIMSNNNNNDNLAFRTRWVMRRNAILGSARFQRWAARVPLVRVIARRRAAAQFDLVAGFVYSQVLLAHVQSGLIGFLSGQLRSFSDIAQFLDLAPDAADRLLRAGAALQLVESPQPGLWTLGEQGAPLSANEGAMAMIRHHPLFYRDLADPLALLVGGRQQETALSAFWSYTGKADDAARGATQDYTTLMAATQPMVAGQALDAYDFTRHRRMLDIGGGSGAFTAAVMAQAPSLDVGIFDLPAVIDHAEQRFGREIANGRVTLHRGSFKRDVLPSGFDLITLVRILHDHDDDVVQALLASIRAALPTGGALLIIEPLAETRTAPRMGDGYFGFYLWAMGSGRPRSLSELTTMLRAAGFASVRRVPTALPIITSAIVATA
jgi:demethylspheroidene O-methyltransferase